LSIVHFVDAVRSSFFDGQQLSPKIATEIGLTMIRRCRNQVICYYLGLGVYGIAAQGQDNWENKGVRGFSFILKKHQAYNANISINKFILLISCYLAEYLKQHKHRNCDNKAGPQPCFPEKSTVASPRKGSECGHRIIVIIIIIIIIIFQLLLYSIPYCSL